jgi:drug/metabolite transporter (DMT)-like permease
MTTLAYTALVGAVLLSVAVPFFWVTPAPEHWPAILGIGFLGAISQFCLIKAYQAAPAAVVAPFSYSNMIWATFYGYVVFGDLPDLYTVVGAVILIASGIYIFHREQIRARR